MSNQMYEIKFTLLCFAYKNSTLVYPEIGWINVFPLCLFQSHASVSCQLVFFCQSHSIRFNLEQTIKNLSAAFDGSVLKFS